MKYKIINSLDELNEKLQELNHSDDAELRVIQIKSLGKVEPLQTAPLLTYTSPQNESAAPKITSQVNAKPLIKRPVFYDVAKTIHPRLNIAYEAYHPRGAVLVDEQKTKMLVLNDFFKRKGVLFYPVDDKSANLDWLLYLCHFLLPCGILGDYIFFPLPLLKIKGGIKSELESNLDNPLVWTQYYPFGQEDFKTVNWDNGYYSADSPENKFSQLKNHRLHDVTEGNFYAIPIDTIELESEYTINPVTYKLLTAFAFPVYEGLMVFAPSVLCEKLLLYLDKKYRASAAPIEQVKKLLHQVKKSELENFENMVLPENKSVIEIIDIEKDSDKLIEGLNLFEQMFKFRSKTFIAPCYTWSPLHEEALYRGGVSHIQGLSLQQVPYSKPKFHYMGMKNRLGQKYLVRNAFFEPVSDSNAVENCLQRISNAFLWHTPAIVSVHRVNFCGEIFENNRTENLKKFDRLLSEIVKRWPDVEFMSSAQLAEII